LGAKQKGLKILRRAEFLTEKPNSADSHGFIVVVGVWSGQWLPCSTSSVMGEEEEEVEEEKEEKEKAKVDPNAVRQ